MSGRHIATVVHALLIPLRPRPRQIDAFSLLMLSSEARFIHKVFTEHAQVPSQTIIDGDQAGTSRDRQHCAAYLSEIFRETHRTIECRYDLRSNNDHVIEP